MRRHATAYALRHPAQKVTVELGRLGPDAVTVGAAILPLADFFGRGGRRPEPAPAGPAPAWRTVLEDRAPAEPASGRPDRARRRGAARRTAFRRACGRYSRVARTNVVR